MKKNIFKMFVVFALVLACSLCLVACGNADKKKEEELAGKYEAIKIEYKSDSEEEYHAVTKAEYEEMADGTMKTVLSYYFTEYEVKLDDHKVYAKVAGSDTLEEMATWEVKDGKLIVKPIEEPEDPETITLNAEIVDGNIVITMTGSSNPYFDSAKLTLSKVQA